MSSPGVGGTTVGSHLKPEAFQLEQTAQDVSAKQSTMIVKDTLQLSFTDMKEPHFKYGNDPKRPLLPMFTQVATYRSDRPDQAWLKTFDQLKQKLPSKLKAQLEQQLKLPPNRRDPRFEGLRRGLEFAAKGLYWLRGAANAITLDEKDRQARDSEYIESLLTTFNEMFEALKRTVLSLPPTSKERAALLQCTKRVPGILLAIGKKRAANKEVALQDRKILREIDEIRSHLKKSLGESPLMIPYYLLDQLEVIHQLSFKGLNLPLYKTLRDLHSLLSYGGHEITFVGKAVSSLGKKLLSILPESIFDKERHTLINILLCGMLAIFQQGAKKQDFGYRLIISMLLTSKFATRMGYRWLKGLLYSDKESRLMTGTILGSAFGSLLIFTNFRALQEEQKEELLKVIDSPLRLLVKRLLIEIDSFEELSGLKLMLRKSERHLEIEPIELVNECQEGLARLEIEEAKLSEDVENINKLLQTIREQMEEHQTDEQKLAFTQNPA